MQWAAAKSGGIPRNCLKGLLFCTDSFQQHTTGQLCRSEFHVKTFVVDCIYKNVNNKVPYAEKIKMGS